MDNIDTAQISEFSNLTRILSNAEVSKNELIEEIQVLTEEVKDQTERYDFFYIIHVICLICFIFLINLNSFTESCSMLCNGMGEIMTGQIGIGTQAPRISS